MNSLIRGNSRTSRSIVQIARELRTTPAYLMGETDDPESNEPDNLLSLSSEEHRLLMLFGQLDSSSRELVLALLDKLGGCDQQSSLHSPKLDYKAQDEQ